MFDPEKVTRYQPWLETGIGDTIVRAEDYDQLLALYREAIANREAYAKGLMTMRQPAEERV